METLEREDRGEADGDSGVIGHRIGHLTTVKIITDAAGIPRRVLFRCDCGKYVRIGLTKIRRNRHRDACRTCWKPPRRGVGRPQKNISKNTHPREYETWRRIRTQARGKWRVSFEKFVKDMGRRPRRGAVLMRYDERELYYPSNCYWGDRARKLMKTPLTYRGADRTPGWVVRQLGIRRSFVTALRRRGVTDVDEMLQAWQQSQEVGRAGSGCGPSRVDQELPGGASQPESSEG